jgi:hypothetical protein
VNRYATLFFVLFASCHQNEAELEASRTAHERLLIETHLIAGALPAIAQGIGEFPELKEALEAHLRAAGEPMPPEPLPVIPPEGMFETSHAKNLRLEIDDNRRLIVDLRNYLGDRDKKYANPGELDKAVALIREARAKTMEKK